MIKLKEEIKMENLDDLADLKIYYIDLCRLYYSSENARVATIVQAELKNVYEQIVKGLANLYYKDNFSSDLDETFIDIHKMCSDESQKKGDE